MRILGQDMVARTPALAHVKLDHIAIVFAQARKRVNYGLFASLTPLRFQQGSLTTKRRGRQYSIQQLFAPSGQELLYILTFYLPRFQDLDLREKLITIFHELWHISPAFDGDIRRHEGRCYAHTGSQAQYDAHMERLVDAWLAQQPPEALWSFLKLNFSDLQQRWGRVTGARIARPRLIPQ
jgi:predicted metallopeptidase